MSGTKPNDGTYFIVSRVTSAFGERLAITFTRRGEKVVVMPLTLANAYKQRVCIANFPFSAYCLTGWWVVDAQDVGP